MGTVGHHLVLASTAAFVGSDELPTEGQFGSVMDQPATVYLVLVEVVFCAAALANHQVATGLANKTRVRANVVQPYFRLHHRRQSKKWWQCHLFFFQVE